VPTDATGKNSRKSKTEKPQQPAAKAEPEQENVLDFVNEIKAQAMVNSFQQAGFIYEPTSGLYYDTKSKYYYSPEHDLYYNGSNGNWYRLNPRTHEFIFHSETEASQAAKKVNLIRFTRCLIANIRFFRFSGSIHLISS